MTGESKDTGTKPINISSQDVYDGETKVVDSMPEGAVDLKQLEADLLSDSLVIDESSKIGEGGVGAVYLVEDPVLKRPTALKALKPEYRRSKRVVSRFLKEAKLTSSIEHPNIIPIHSMGADDRHGIYYTMKKIDGDDLQKIIDQLIAGDPEYKEKYSLNRLLDIFVSACHGVAYAHSKGLIHRDIKPENIIVGEYGEVLVIDWGLVKDINDANEHMESAQNIESQLETQTMDGQIVGTPMYISPEQLKSEPEYASDQYSLGVALYHILTLNYPFTLSGSILDLLNQIQKGECVSPREKAPYASIPKELDAICMKAMSRDIKDRYEDVNHLIEDLQNYKENKKLIAYRDSVFTRIIKLARRHPVVSTAITASLAAAFFVTAVTAGVFAVRYELALDNAEENLVSGNYYFDKVNRLNDGIKTLKAQNDYRKFYSGREEELRKELAQVEGMADSHFRIAFSELQKIGPHYCEEQVKNSFKEVFSKRLEMARELQNYDVMSTWTHFIDLWSKNYKGNITSEERDIMSMLQEEVTGAGSISIAQLKVKGKVRIWRVDLESGSKSIVEDWFELNQPYTSKLARGSYLIDVALDNSVDFVYPVMISHSEHEAVELEIPGSIPDGFALVSAGKSIFGGEFSLEYRKHERFLDSYFIKKNEVSFDEYLEFWKSLNKELRNEFMPYVFSGPQKDLRPAFEIDGGLIESHSLGSPVHGISIEAGRAYCNWKSLQDGMAYRLPTALEWEKAARGADGRGFVWGNKITYQNRPNAGQYKDDMSVYGVRNMSGKVREYVTSGSRALIKGSGFASSVSLARVASSQEAVLRPLDVGFRYVLEPGFVSK